MLHVTVETRGSLWRITCYPAEAWDDGVRRHGEAWMRQHVMRVLGERPAEARGEVYTAKIAVP